MLKHDQPITANRSMYAICGETILDGFCGRVHKIYGELWAVFPIYDSLRLVRINEESEGYFDADK